MATVAALRVAASVQAAAVQAAAVQAASAGATAADDAVIVVLLPDGGRGYLAKVFDDSWMSMYGFLSADASQAMVGDVLRGKDGRLPELVHGHPNETVADIVGYLREFGVSQLPIVAAEPPVMAAEVVGSVNERDLLDALFAGRAALADRVERHMSAPLPTIGAGEPVAAAMRALTTADGALVLVDGKPAGVVTRQDVLAFLSH
jgi:cystathionine beta-synthase